jgi:dTDP-glucose 4,6-dehydratase
MKLFVTGGAGFIGSNFIRHILNKYPDYEVVNFDKLTYAGNLENLKDVENSPRYKFIKGDICDKAAVTEAAQGADAIVNFAAETHVDRSIHNDDAFIMTNVLGVKIILEAAQALGVKKIVQISTDEVYGDIPVGDFSKEEDILTPSSPYSAAKAAGDLLCLSYRRTHGAPVVITRSSNNYGSHQYPEKVIPLFITNLLEGKKVPVYGDGLQTRDWLHVQDNCEAIDLVVHQGADGEIYNIGANQEEISNLDLTRKIVNICNGNECHIEYVADRRGHDRRYALNTDKIRGLGWAPKINFHDGLTKTAEWYKNNRQWWEKIKSGEYLEYYKKQYS